MATLTNLLLAILVASELGRWVITVRNYRIEVREVAARRRQYEKVCADFDAIYGPRQAERKGAVAN